MFGKKGATWVRQERGINKYQQNKIYQQIKNEKATLYPSEGCFSDVRGPFRTQNPQQSQQTKRSVRKGVHTSGTGFENDRTNVQQFI